MNKDEGPIQPVADALKASTDKLLVDNWGILKAKGLTVEEIESAIILMARTSSEMLHLMRENGIKTEMEASIWFNGRAHSLGLIKTPKVYYPERYFDRNDKFQPGLLAEDMARAESIITIRDMGQEIVYLNGGVYHKGDDENGDSYVLSRLKGIMGDRLETLKRHHINEILSQLRLRTFKDYSYFNPPIELLPVQNGVLNLLTGELLAYESVKQSFLFQLPVIRDPAADCPAFKQFLKEVTYPQDAAKIEEMIGYCLWRDYYIKKGFMLVGEGDNGKSLFFTVLSALLGPENISTVSLTHLSENRFASFWLRDKMANIFADLPDRAVKETGMFKMLTGDDLVPYEIKGGGLGHFTSYAKQLFSANKIPDAKDDTNAYYGRWEIITFPWVYVSKSQEQCVGNERPLKAKDTLLKSLTTPQELSGILNLALAGLKRLRENSGFTGSLDTEQIRSKYVRMSNSLKAFVSEQCRIALDISPGVTKREFFQRYMKYCEDNQLAKKDIGTVGKDLPQISSSISPKRHRLGGGPPEPCWDGVAWLGTDPNEPPDPDQGKVDDFANQPRSPDEGMP